MAINNISSYDGYDELDIDNAEIFKQSGIMIITPVDSLDELEDDWEAFNRMDIEHKEVSNDKSIELFGRTNQDHYEDLKHNFLNIDIHDDDKIYYDGRRSVSLTERLSVRFNNTN